MSVTVVGRVFLKKAYGVVDSVLIEQVLKECGDELTGSKKGRYWELTKDSVTITIDVRPTESQFYDCEDEMLDLGLLPEDAPEMVSISGHKNSYELCSLITKQIVAELEGISNGAEYCS